MINTVALMGRMAADPELRTTTKGDEVVSFTLALDAGYGDKKTTSWVDCVAFKGSAKFVSTYFRKGSMIAITGRISTRNYEDKNGAKRKSTEVICESVSFCGDKQSNNPAALPDDTTQIVEEELPF